MTTCLGKSCSFGLPRVPFVNCCQFMYSVFSSFPFDFEDRIWDLIVSVPAHCLYFYFDFINLKIFVFHISAVKDIRHGRSALIFYYCIIYIYIWFSVIFCQWARHGTE